MAVEQYSLAMAQNSMFDTVTATIRGDTAPALRQAYTLTMDGYTVAFEVESIEEQVRSATERAYTIQGRELRTEVMFRPVSLDIDLMTIDGGQRPPRASEIVRRAAGITVNYSRIDDFPLSLGSFGWRVDKGVLYIREANIESLLQKLFGWSDDCGDRKICYRIRNGQLFVWDMNRADGQTINVTDSNACNITIRSSIVRKFTAPMDTAGNAVTTPLTAVVGGGGGSYPTGYPIYPPGDWGSGIGGIGNSEWGDYEEVYVDTPFESGAEWGDAVQYWANGCLTTNTQGAGDDRIEEHFTYAVAFGATVLATKRTVGVHKETTTQYRYVRARGPSGEEREEPALYSETTTSKSSTEEAPMVFEPDDESTITYHVALGAGFYGQTVVKMDKMEVVSRHHSITRNSPGGAASQYTTRRKEQGKWIPATTTQTAEEQAASDANKAIITQIQGQPLVNRPIPIGSTVMGYSYLACLWMLHGKTESVITVELVGQDAINPFMARLTYAGLEYYVTDAVVTHSARGRRVRLTGKRWST